MCKKPKIARTITNRRLPPYLPSAIMEGRRRLYRVAHSYCQIWRSTTEMANPLIRFFPHFWAAGCGESLVILISASVCPSTRWLFLMREREGRWRRFATNFSPSAIWLLSLARNGFIHERKGREMATGGQSILLWWALLGLDFYGIYGLPSRPV